MFQLLTFLVEKLSFLCHFKLLQSSLPGEEQHEQQGERGALRVPHHPQRGDLLEVPRTIFTHFGIYLGDNRVAHLIPDILPVFTNDSKLTSSVVTNKRLILGSMYRCATVRVDTLEDFAYGCNIFVNRLDRVMEAQAFPNEDVAERAEKLVGKIKYSLLWNNCEHFVTHCRYGQAASRQTEKFCQCLKSIIRDRRSVVVTGLLGLLCAAFFGMASTTTIPTMLISFTLWMAG